MNKLLKVFFITLIIGVVIGIAGGGIAYYYLMYPHFHPEKTAYIFIDENDDIDSVYYKLTEQGNPSNMSGFKWIAQYKKYDERIRTGKYAVEPNDNAYGLYQRLAGGQQTPVNLTIGSVRTLDRIARNVGSQLMVDSTDIARRLNDPVFINELGYDEASIYSLFIPNTYQVYWNLSVDEFFDRMEKEHTRFWNESRRAKAQAIGLTPEEVSTLASIVDEETNAKEEKPRVAGLYMNRLHRGMLLQADPTVKFAWGDFGLRRILFRHLEIDSPYNTYMYAGLPPGPIRVPTIEGIDAVLNYERHSYLYMTAKEDFSGRHNFATNLTQHNINARKYHEALNKRKIYE